MDITQIDEMDLHIKQFEESFSKLVKNRDVLCTKEGILKKDAIKYKNAYQSLLNTVTEKGIEVAMDSISYFYIPKDKTGEQCRQEIEKVFKDDIAAPIEDVLRFGTAKEFFDKVSAFRDRCVDIYLDYIKKGMHKVFLSNIGGHCGL